MTNEKYGYRTFTVTSRNGQTQSIKVKGRDLWALENLMHAGERGCTPLHNPAPRWSGYIYNLRKAGVDIETITEPHKGPFSGTHGRYVLRSNIIPQEAA